ncbi:cobalamin biosynthesis protein CobQ [Planktotalea arctica]|uniref:cobalamin biosynthesis protein CobQ n=1 Tax=Planktotalea arctica TaxID=1481893 RepID=UPI00321B606C
MNTPAHLILGLAVFSRKDTPRVTGASAVGAVLPDLSLYVMAGASLFILQVPPDVVFGQLYFSQSWQTVFAIDNSFLLWGLVLSFALWFKARAGAAFAGAGLLHLAMDFPLHHDDGRPHFWPASDWIFKSPVSYWDSLHYANWVAPLEGLMVLICAGVLFRRFQRWPMRLLALALLGMEFMVIRSWLLFF